MMIDFQLFLYSFFLHSKFLNATQWKWNFHLKVFAQIKRVSCKKGLKNSFRNTAPHENLLCEKIPFQKFMKFMV